MDGAREKKANRRIDELFPYDHTEQHEYSPLQFSHPEYLADQEQQSKLHLQNQAHSSLTNKPNRYHKAR